MKKLLILLTVMGMGFGSLAQEPVSPYLKTKKLPAFSLLNIDSVAFTQTALSKEKPVIIMLFNPECGHCKDQLTLLLKMPEVTQAAQLVMATTETLDKIKAFAETYNLAGYPSIFIGRDKRSFWGGYFQPKTIPVLAFYDKEGNFKKLLQGSSKKKEIIEALK
jgi:thiol-disulfide isomerase/thioredoxin